MSFHQQLKEAWQELVTWIESGKFSPENEEDIQCFLYRSIVNLRSSALNVRPKATIVRKDKLVFPDFLLGDTKHPEVAIEIKFVRNGKAGSILTKCEDDILKLRRHYGRRKATHRVFILIDSHKDKIFLSPQEYDYLCAVDPSCEVLIYPENAFNDSSAKKAGSKASETKKINKQKKIRHLAAVAANATKKAKAQQAAKLSV